MDKMFNELAEWCADDGEEMLKWLDDAKAHIENNWETYGKGHDFVGDKCKISDMLLCGKWDYLESYSYLTEKDYDATVETILGFLESHGVFSNDSIKEYEEYDEVMCESEV